MERHAACFLSLLFFFFLKAASIFHLRRRPQAGQSVSSLSASHQPLHFTGFIWLLSISPSSPLKNELKRKHLKIKSTQLPLPLRSPAWFLSFDGSVVVRAMDSGPTIL